MRVLPLGNHPVRLSLAARCLGHVNVALQRASVVKVLRVAPQKRVFAGSVRAAAIREATTVTKGKLVMMSTDKTTKPCMRWRETPCNFGQRKACICAARFDIHIVPNAETLRRLQAAQFDEASITVRCAASCVSEVVKCSQQALLLNANSAPSCNCNQMHMSSCA